MYLLFIICEMGITGPTSECPMQPINILQVKPPDVSNMFVLYVVPCRADTSRAEDAEQNQTFYFI